MKMSIETTRSGRPALWENGGATAICGDAIIVAEPDGTMPTAIYTNGSRALIIIRPGMLVIEASQHMGDYRVKVYRIETIDTGSLLAELSLLHEYEQGEWLPGEPPEGLAEAIRAATKKARCYHCWHVHYAQEPAGRLL